MSSVPSLAERQAIVLARNEDPETLEARYRSLGPVRRRAMVTMVLRHVDDPDPALRESCAWVLHVMRPDDGTLEPAALDGLLTLARDEDDDVRDWALFALGRGSAVPLDRPDVRSAMRASAAHGNPRVRREAVEGLAQVGDVTALQVALEEFDVDPETVAAAAQAADPDLYRPLVHLRLRGWAATPAGVRSPELGALLDDAISRCRG